MAITSIIEDWRSRTSDDTPAGRTYNRFFSVRFDGTDDPNVIERLANETQLALPDRIPARFEAHPGDTSVVVSNKRVTRLGPQDCIVTCEYKSPAAISREYPQPVSDNPLNDPPEVTWRGVAVSSLIEVDLDDKPICNSAHEPIECPEDVWDQVLVYTKNVSSFNAAQAAEYFNAMNRDYFLGRPPETAKIIRYDGDVRYIASSENPGVYTPYVRVTIEIQFHKDGWRRKFKDEGYREYTGDSGGEPQYEIIKDKDGNPVTQPVRLNGTGGIQQNPATSDPVILTFRTVESLPFSVLGIT